MTKKETERLYLDRFKECWPDFPAGTIVDEEPPDFLVHTSSGILGIELTRVFHPVGPDQRPMQADESRENQIIAGAKQDYDDAGGPPLIVHINFIQGLKLTRLEMTALSKRLATIVRQSLPAQPGRVILQNRWHPGDPLPAEIYSMSVLRSDGITKAMWSTARAGWTWNLRPDDVQRELADKNQRFASYTRVCDRCWLILIATGEQPSQLIETPAATVGHPFVAAFEKVFIFEVANRRIHELTIVSAWPASFEHFGFLRNLYHAAAYLRNSSSRHKDMLVHW